MVVVIALVVSIPIRDLMNLNRLTPEAVVSLRSFNPY